VAIDLVNIPSARFSELNPAAGESFKKMRQSIGAGGPLDYETSELVLLACFAQCGFEEPFKIHALRGLKAGIEIKKMQHALQLLLGATCPLYPVVRALGWLEEAVTHHQGGA
jgi:alkylhydroperoxidase/carboxymuconolactone decarboxylase family protein YurZ